MTDRQPIETKNLDGYGNPGLPWERARSVLAAGSTGAEITHFLGTIRPDGRPHAAGVGAIWMDGDLYFVSGAGTQKSRNLVEHPACTISAHLDGIDLVFEGEAEIVRDEETLVRAAQIYRDSGWVPEVKDGAFTAPYSAPSAGPPPWDVYRMTYHTVYGVASAEPYGATRWRFE